MSSQLKSPSFSLNSPHFLIELRARLLRVLFIFFIVFALLAYFANDLYQWLSLPMLKFLPQGHLIATQIISPFFVPFKLAFITAILIIAPYFLYEIWAFITPALYGHERRLIWPFLFISAFLFYIGLAFAYFIIFPMLFNFLSHLTPKTVTLSPDISEYLDFTIKLLLVFGTLFEIPIIMVLLVATGVVTRAVLLSIRPYAIVGAFVIGMLFAPPDVFSQTILALPIWFLYEIGLLFCKKKKY